MRNGAATLPACLAALTQQTQPPHEIIVVNDGSTDATAQLARAYPVQVLEIAPSGPAIARNVGAQHACGELLLFTDADCAPAPDWVAQLSAPFADPQLMGAKGAYRTQQRSWVARLVQQEYADKYDRLHQHLAQHGTIDFIDTYSAAYRRSVFLANGGFSPLFPKPSVEDQEFSFRLAAQGHRLTFVPTAIVYHQHDATLREYGARKFGIGYWKAGLLRQHPHKALGDAHTPRSQRWQVVLGLFLGLFLLGGLCAPWLWSGALGLSLLFYATALPLTLKVWRRDPGVVPGLPILLLLRAWALGLGLVLGGAAVVLNELRHPKSRQP